RGTCNSVTDGAAAAWRNTPTVESTVLSGFTGIQLTSRSFFFLNCICPIRDVFSIHLNTLFQTCIPKSPLLYVHQILLPRKQRAEAYPFWPGSPRFTSEPCNQILHDSRRDSRTF